MNKSSFKVNNPKKIKKNNFKIQFRKQKEGGNQAQVEKLENNC